MKKQFLAIIGIVLSAAVSIFAESSQIFDGQASIVLGLLFFAIFFWVANIFDDYVVALIMGAGWVILAKIPFATAFSIFSSQIWWLVLSALAMGTAFAKSGLLYRCNVYILNKLPETYLGRLIGIFLSGIIICPLIPSVIGKVSLAGRFVSGLSAQMDLKPESNISAGLFYSMYLGFILAGPFFLTGSATNFVILEMIPDSNPVKITWMTWFIYSLPGLILMMTAGFIYIYIKFAPADLKEFPTGTSKKSNELGPMSKKEKLAAVYLIITMILWIGEPLHKIPASLITISGMVMMLMSGIIDKKDFEEKSRLGFLIFFGITMNIAAIFDYTGISPTIAQIILPSIKTILENPYVFIAILVPVVFVLRFIFVSYNSLIIILMLVLVPISSTAGIHPWALGTIIHLASQSVWFLRYQNQVHNLAFNISGAMTSTKQDSKTSFYFMALTFVVILISTFYWKFTGLIQ